jgi:inorganic triphosphatase YgiF
MPISEKYLEYETTLVIIGKNARDTVEEICRLKSIGGYTTSAPRYITIHDIYFDTEKGELGAKKMALRLRFIRKDVFLTMKGPSSTKDELSKRLEIEKRWTKNSLEEIFAIIKNEGIDISDSLPDFNDTTQEAYLFAAGFKAVQDRRTKRTLKDVLVNNVPAAEIAIDRTTYNFDGKKVHHREIEVEAKSTSGQQVVLEVTKTLLEKYDNLKPWIPSKLITGKAIKLLLNENQLDKHIDLEGTLLSSAYKKLKDKISVMN